MNLQRGRPTVTLVVVVVILAVVVASAIPRWRNHQIISRMETALTAADGAKVTVVEAATVRGGVSRVKASELSFNHSATGNPYVARIDIADGGRITISTRDTGAEPDPRLLLTPIQGNNSDQSPISWRCSVSVGDTDAAPANCRDAFAPGAPTLVIAAASAATTPAHSS